MDCKERLEGYLREQGVSFEVQQHRLAYTAQKVAASEHVPGRMFAKVVIAETDQDDLLMLVLPASAVVDTAKASEAAGGRPVHLATEREFAPRFPDCEAGAMPPFGNLYDVPVYVDRAVGANERIIFQAGTHTDTMSVAYRDFERLVHPTVADLAAGR
jgi:Ala-tRNA(Pro) deacylase